MIMKILKTFAAVSAALGILSAQSAQACWSDNEAQAASIANLNMMMMVTALRCRKGDYNFLAEYNHFVKNNNAALGAQNAVIKARFARMNGTQRAEAEMDGFTVGLANHYGTGHTIMGCAELKQLATDLASLSRDMTSLVNIADLHAGMPTLPGGSCSARIAAR